MSNQDYAFGMLSHNIFQLKKRMVFTTIALSLTGLTLSSCSRTLSTTNEESSETATTQTQDTAQMNLDNTADGQTPVISGRDNDPKDTNQAAANESTQLNALNKDSNTVDQSFNDQALSVN